jgi:hypothetical protein
MSALVSLGARKRIAPPSLSTRSGQIASEQSKRRLASQHCVALIRVHSPALGEGLWASVLPSESVPREGGR